MKGGGGSGSKPKTYKKKRRVKSNANRSNSNGKRKTMRNAFNAHYARNGNVVQSRSGKGSVRQVFLEKKPKRKTRNNGR